MQCQGSGDLCDPHSWPESALVTAKEDISEAVALRLVLLLHLQEDVKLHY